MRPRSRIGMKKAELPPLIGFAVHVFGIKMAERT
jgi:hypothetical protein